MTDSTNIYALQSGTLDFKTTNIRENRTLVGFHLAMCVIKLPRVSVYWEARMDNGIFRRTKYAHSTMRFAKDAWSFP